MRQAESDYWDVQADKRLKYISDNVWKRAAILHRLFTVEWVDKRILEIGVGFASVAAVMRVVYLDNFKYIGTDVSPMFCKKAKDFFDVDVVNTDLINLPVTDGGFNRIIALDSLEHVKPEDRPEGYRRLGVVMAPDATLFINMPMEETQHDLEFDHPFGYNDLIQISDACKARITKYEEYTIHLTRNDTYRKYGWAVIQRGNGG